MSRKGHRLTSEVTFFAVSDRSILFRLFLVSSGFSSIFDDIYFFTPFSIKPVRKDVTAKCVSFRASRSKCIALHYLVYIIRTSY